jgi:hypothetical protein
MLAKNPLPRSPTYATIRNEVGVFTNVFCILDKIEEDQHLEAVADLFRQIFQREIEYTIVGGVTRAPETAGTHP